MSSSSVEATLSVVIGSAGPGMALEACLSGLEPQRDGVEVLVCEGQKSPTELRTRFPWACFVERPGGLVPELWSEGIARATGEIVALTIAPMLAAPNWIETIREHHRRFDVVAGAIEPGLGLRLVDWAEYLCRYAKDMLPFEGHRCLDLPGDNASYKRPLLERMRELYEDGFWEPVVHRRLADEGVALWHTPEIVVRQGRSAGARLFWRQRLAHGRHYGRERGAEFGRGRNLAGVLASPLVPLLLSLRVLRQVARKRRHGARAFLALPLILAFNVAWAIGEARGHLETLRGR